MGCFGELDHITMSEMQLGIKNVSILFLLWLKIDPEGTAVFPDLNILGQGVVSDSRII